MLLRLLFHDDIQYHEHESDIFKTSTVILTDYRYINFICMFAFYVEIALNYILELPKTYF